MAQEFLLSRVAAHAIILAIGVAFITLFTAPSPIDIIGGISLAILLFIFAYILIKKDDEE